MHLAELLFHLLDTSPCCLPSHVLYSGSEFWSLVFTFFHSVIVHIAEQPRCVQAGLHWDVTKPEEVFQDILICSHNRHVFLRSSVLKQLPNTWQHMNKVFVLGPEYFLAH